MNLSELLSLIHPAELVLNNDEVHIWYGNYTSDGRYMEMMRRVISDYEINRAYKFFFSKDRDRFIITRAVLRILISKYQNVDIHDIKYLKNYYGKPFILSSGGKPQLKFNISHSNSAFIMAFSRNREIGVDIEKLRSDFPAEEIARMFFSRNEINELLQLRGKQLTKAFFDCWTRKEAYIKAKGMGLSIDLSSFDVSIAADQPAKILAFRNNTEEADKWEVHALHPFSGYSAAIVIERRMKKTRIINKGNVLNNFSVLKQ